MGLRVGAGLARDVYLHYVVVRPAISVTGQCHTGVSPGDAGRVVIISLAAPLDGADLGTGVDGRHADVQLVILVLYRERLAEGFLGNRVGPFSVGRTEHHGLHPCFMAPGAGINDGMWRPGGADVGRPVPFGVSNRIGASGVDQGNGVSEPDVVVEGEGNGFAGQVYGGDRCPRLFAVRDVIGDLDGEAVGRRLGTCVQVFVVGESQCIAGDGRADEGWQGCAGSVIRHGHVRDWRGGESGAVADGCRIISRWDRVSQGHGVPVFRRWRKGQYHVGPGDRNR